MSTLGRVWRASWDGFRNRCPECRRGRIWDRDGSVHQQCAECGLRFEPDEVDWGGFSWAYAIEGVVVSVGGVVVSSVLELFADLPWTTHAYLWVAILILFHLMYYRNMKGQWIGMRTALMGRPGSRV